MKTTLLFALTMLSASMIAQQIDIPNAGFENWNLDNTWTLDPDDWETQNGQLVEHVTQDDEPYEGNWAMRVTYSDASLGYYGSATAEAPTTFIPAALTFYVKTEVEFAAVGVMVRFYNGENEFYTEDWSTAENITDWTLIEMPLNQIEPVMDRVEIEVYFVGGDFVASEGWISVDAMAFTNTLSVEDPTADENPFWFNAQTNTLNRISDDGATILRMYSLTGALFSEQWWTGRSIPLEDLSAGVYIAQTQDPQSGSAQAQRIVVMD